MVPCSSLTSTVLAPCSTTFRWRTRWLLPTIARPMTGAVRADAKIGMDLNCFTPVYTKENPSEADLEAVRMTSGINNRWWLDLITKGELPADVPGTARPRAATSFRSAPVTSGRSSSKGVVDWLGCNYYHPIARPGRRRARSTSTVCRTLPTSTCGPMPSCEQEPRGWEIYPWKGPLTTLAWTAPRTIPILSVRTSLRNGVGIMDEPQRIVTRRGEPFQDDYRVEDFVRQHLECGSPRPLTKGQVPRLPPLGCH